jgi:hypothetical protein
MRYPPFVADGPAVTAFGETISIAFSGAPPIVARRLLSLLAACAILAVALPAAFGGGTWNGGVDTGHFFAQDAPAHATKPPAPR